MHVQGSHRAESLQGNKARVSLIYFREDASWIFAPGLVTLFGRGSQGSWCSGAMHITDVQHMHVQGSPHAESPHDACHLLSPWLFLNLLCALFALCRLFRLAPEHTIVALLGIPMDFYPFLGNR